VKGCKKNHATERYRSLSTRDGPFNEPNKSNR